MDIKEALQIIEVSNRGPKLFDITLDQSGRKALVRVQALSKKAAKEVIANSAIVGKIIKVQEVK